MALVFSLSILAGLIAPIVSTLTHGLMLKEVALLIVVENFITNAGFWIHWIWRPKCGKFGSCCSASGLVAAAAGLVGLCDAHGGLNGVAADDLI
ncbi:hypothetical protein HN873_026051 [Arachis hypogaea]